MTVFMDEIEIVSYSDRSGDESEREAVAVEFESIFIHFVNTPTGAKDLRSLQSQRQAESMWLLRT